MKVKLIFLISILFTSFLFSQTKSKVFLDNKFLLGNEVLLDKNSEIIKGKQIALITNKSGVMSDGTLFLDALNKNFIVTKIFTPEHGLRGDDRDENYTDEVTGIPIISLYGANKKPSPDELISTDVFIYDIQDVSARFYTFINTMYYCMESAVENKKEFIVCDRPVIPNADYTDGFLLDEDVKSFVGLIDVPIAYAMTCGELANFINEKYFNNQCRLTVIKMENYSHETDYAELNLPWIKPSPNMYFPSSAICYLGTCLFEGTNFSEGRGTDKPFEYIGAPFCDGKKLSDELKSYQLSGVEFVPVTFIPQTITSPSNPPKFVGQNCEGVYIKVTDKNFFEPVKAAIAVLVSLKKLFPEFEIKNNNFLDKLAGTPNLRFMVQNGNSFIEIIDSYSSSLSSFKKLRQKYLLY